MKPAEINQALTAVVIVFLLIVVGYPQTMNPRLYDMGAPVLTDIWVDRGHGNDSYTGTTRTQALATISEAWNRIPTATLSTTGYRIQIVAGTYSESEVPSYWDGRHGTFLYPIILNAVEGRGTVILPNVNIFNCHYLYLIDLQIEANGGDALHFEGCTHMLVRNSVVKGIGDVDQYEGPQEAFKVNQCQYIYVEDSDISGGWDNAVDFVAVQYGHLVGNMIHRAHEWCLYLKGGSAYFRIEANELYDATTGGFTAGQGTGFEYMISPWLHYEAYDLKFISNLIHDVGGPGMGVNGGYNILLAYNTLYRVGRTSHAIETVFGSRSCDGDAARCRQNLLAGGWGTDVPGNAESIPSQNVYIYNNLLLNPDDHASAWQHFAIYGPRTAASSSNIPSPVRCDVNLQIRGNVIWNGAADLPLGIEPEDQGCQNSNPTCFAAQLRRDNAINTLKPVFIDINGHDFHPAAASVVFSAQTYAIPDFPGNDRPGPPQAPAGALVNLVERDLDGDRRTLSSPPGAYSSSTTQIKLNAADPAKRIQLQQNFPNPFNLSTQIGFDLPARARISLQVYDVHGTWVRTIAEGTYSPGYHTFRMDGQRLPSGIYWLRLQSENSLQITKMALIK